MKIEFSRKIFIKNTQMSHFIKIHPLGAELLRVDGLRDMTKLLTAYRNFANVQKACIL